VLASTAIGAAPLSAVAVKDFVDKVSYKYSLYLMNRGSALADDARKTKLYKDALLWVKARYPEYREFFL
jgi:hypothetical protein